MARAEGVALPEAELEGSLGSSDWSWRSRWPYTLSVVDTTAALPLPALVEHEECAHRVDVGRLDGVLEAVADLRDSGQMENDVGVDRLKASRRSGW